ncbi:MAG: crosslink repair DNA glycosylase YcaQ family protein [Aquabacterium sp.]|nr:crosslink repair DNA glycosylase YcaQ family protein [Aquabacterium sp.]
MPAITLDHLRHHAVARTLFAPTTLPQAINRLGFVQADPIRAPARAQDLTLRHRVQGYRAGDLEARYPRLAVEEDFFVNYGFLPRPVQALMHPRNLHSAWPATRQRQAAAVLDFVRDRGVVHPREVDAQFQHGKAKNWFGGNSNASTQLLDAMHFGGLLRIARREGGVRLYAPRTDSGTAPDPQAAMDALADVVLASYAPLPLPSFSMLVHRAGHGAPQWQHLCRATVQRARQRLPQVVIDGVPWLWPDGEQPASRRHATRAQADAVRLLAPFDPIVWDRRRFALLWGWDYRFEAYTPAPRRVRGYYALPLLWRDAVIGWANLAVQGGVLVPDIGFVSGHAPADAGFAAALDAELQRMASFLGMG